MRKYLVVLALLVMPAVAFGAAENSMRLFVDGGTDVTLDIDALPATLELTLVIDSEEFAIGTWQSGVEASVAGVFAITEEVLGTRFNTQMASAIGPLDPKSPIAVDMVLFHADGDVQPEELPLTVATWTLALDTDAIGLGDYTLTPHTNKLVSSVGGDIEGENLITAGVTVNVIPEPATMLLLAGALPFLRRRRA